MLLFNPKVLELIVRFKRGGSRGTLANIVAILIDNIFHLDIEYLKKILFSYSVFSDERELERLIQKKYVKKRIGGVFVCFCRNIKANKYADIVFEKRKTPPTIFGDINTTNYIDLIPISRDNNQEETVEEVKIFRPELPNTLALDDTLLFRSVPDVDLCVRHAKPKKKRLQPNQPNVLSFLSIRSPTTEYQTGITTIRDTGRFAPLEIKNATFMYDPNRISLDTIRKRDDLVNPVKLQFIKHFDQIKPPIYQKRDIMKYCLYSYKKIPDVLSYTDDSSSEWMEIEQSSSETLEEYSTDDESESADWIEEDSECVETTRYNKKPMLSLDENVRVVKYFDEEKYLKANLFMISNLPESLKNGILKREVMTFAKESGMVGRDLINGFSELYNITADVIIQELGC